MKDKYDLIVGEICILEKYLYKCDEKCIFDCFYIGINKIILWICYICYRKLFKGIVLVDLFMNNFELEDVLKEFGCFNLLEYYFVVLNILFMKIFGLLKGG